MADAAQRQRKLAAKAARRKQVVAEKKKLEHSSASLAGKVRLASKGRIVRCVMPAELLETGLCNVVVARALPTGLLGCGFFLVDMYCLGVKDVFYREMSQGDLRDYLEAVDDTQALVDCDPARARKLVRDAAAYAAGLGLPAAADTPVIEAIFGDVDANACPEIFTFGRDGMPFFVPGPYDTPARIRTITRALQQAGGEGALGDMVDAILGLQGTRGSELASPDARDDAVENRVG